MSPARRRACVEHVVRGLGLSERKACAVLGQHRSTQRKAPRSAEDEAGLTAEVVELAKRYGWYGYRRITALLADLFIARGAPAHIRSDQGPELVAEAVKAWITGVGTKTAYIEKARPWENGYVESFNGKLRDELLNGEVFNTLKEAQVLIEEWRRHYNRVRPHSSLGYRPPAPETAPMARSQTSSGGGPAAMAH